MNRLRCTEHLAHFAMATRTVCAAVLLLGLTMFGAPATRAASVQDMHPQTASSRPASMSRVHPLVKTSLWGYTSHATPAITVWGTSLMLAWTGDDSGHHLNISSSTNGTGFSQAFKLTATALANTGPAICLFSGRLYFVWTDSGTHLHVAYYDQTTMLKGDITQPEETQGTPGCTVSNNLLWITWRGLDNHINVRNSTNGSTWDAAHKWTETDTGSYGASISPAPWTSDVQIAYAGSDILHSGNLGTFTYTNQLSSCNPFGGTWANDIGLAAFGSRLYGAQIDANHNVWLGWLTSCGDYSNSGNATYSETSNYGVALTPFNGALWMAWAGTDPSSTLNVRTA